MSVLTQRLARLEKRTPRGDDMVWTPTIPDDLIEMVATLCSRPIEEVRADLAPRLIPRKHAEMPPPIDAIASSFGVSAEWLRERWRAAA